MLHICDEFNLTVSSLNFEVNSHRHFIHKPTVKV